VIAKLIRWSIANRFLVLLATLMVTGWGVWSLSRTPLDAIPDLSDVQVIIRTTFPGQAPQIVENQITYPLTTTMLSVPGAKVVRGYSMFGDSFVYILFEDGTDPYWARSRVLEYLNQVQSRLPAQAKASLGPDATGVGWVYEYALIDRTGHLDLSQLRALQDWFLKYELKTVPNVSEVASVGGMVRQYQIVLDPDRLRAHNVTQGKVIDAVQKANQETGGSVLELGEAERFQRTVAGSDHPLRLGRDLVPPGITSAHAESFDAGYAGGLKSHRRAAHTPAGSRQQPRNPGRNPGIAAANGRLLRHTGGQ